MKFMELLNQTAEILPAYRQVIFKTFVIAMLSGCSRTSSVFRRFACLFKNGSVTRKRFYNFLNSGKLPWDCLWRFLSKVISGHIVRGGRIMVALDDTTYGKSGKNIAGCATHFDHAAKKNSAKWIFGHCRVVAGILIFAHGRWMCLPFAQQLFQPLPKNVKDSRKLSYAQWLKTKSGIGATLVAKMAKLFNKSVLIVCDSWFGTKPLLEEARRASETTIHLLTRLRVNSILFAFPIADSGRRGRPRKYGKKLKVKTLAAQLKVSAMTRKIHLYGKLRDCTFAETICMSKALQCKIKVVFIYRKNSVFPLLSTDLDMSAEEMIEYYSARWKIESGFKEIKHEIAALDSQCRNANAVENHFELCCFVTSMAWAYVLLTPKAPARMHPTSKSNAYAFADVRRQIISELHHSIFHIGCLKEVIPAVKFICSKIFYMAA